MNYKLETINKFYSDIIKQYLKEDYVLIPQQTHGIENKKKDIYEIILFNHYQNQMIKVILLDKVMFDEENNLTLDIKKYCN